tara:strand:- start:143 stop:1459 length:1317 start_codon:yes stop_codon:yes gene_type:complete
MNIEILHGDCLDVLKTLDDNSIDSIVTDPPYGLSFMGKRWDYDVPSVAVWCECLRVLKHGGHLLSFAGARTYHRMAVNIEDAGFEIRDQIMWVYGSGFPKSLNIGKAVDKLQGNDREVVGVSENEKDFRDLGKNTKEIHGLDKLGVGVSASRKSIDITKGNTEHEGWGTALKPAHEPIVMARKPLSEKTIAKNVLKWGTGGINIDGCRVGTNPQYKYNADKNGTTFHGKQGERIKQTAEKKGSEVIISTKGRFPANFIHDGSDEVVGLFPNSKSASGQTTITRRQGTWDRDDKGMFDAGRSSTFEGYGDSGSASRFFYCPKANKKERNAGCEDMRIRQVNKMNSFGKQENHTCSDGANRKGDKGSALMQNHHPTVKPLALMRYLCRLVTPPSGVVLDPFMGSGTTGIAAKAEGFGFVGIEREADYAEIAMARIDAIKR